MSRILTLFVVLTPAIFAQLPGGNWRTDLSKKSIDLGELRSGGPPKDGIPAIDDPKFETVAEASRWLAQKEPLQMVRIGGEVRAYPLQILMWHELVNDTIGETPILASYCPLCNSAIVFDRRLDGKVYDFGVSGMLRNSDMVMYDRQTDSLWQQITGEAIVGQLTGSELRMISSQVVAFEIVAASYPEAKILSRNTGYDRPYGNNPYAGYEFGNRLMMPVSVDMPPRLKPMERIVVVSSGKTDRAYPFSLLRRSGVYSDRLKDQRFVIFYEDSTLTPLDDKQISRSKAVGSVGVFSPDLEGRRLSFRRKGEQITDKETGTVWNVLGVAIDGPLTGKALAPVDHGLYFAFAWLAFRPQTEVIGIAANQPVPVTSDGGSAPRLP